MILAANGRDGYYFGAPTSGVHGGLYPGESEAVLTFAYPDGSPDEVVWMRETVQGVVVDRCANEGRRQPSVADMMPALFALWGVQALWGSQALWSLQALWGIHTEEEKR